MNASFSITIGADTVTVTTSQSKEVKIDSTDEGSKRTMSLLALSYHKKIYQPGLVLAKVQLKRNDYTKDDTGLNISAAKIISCFANAEVTAERNSTKVAQDYYIYKVIPEFKRDSNSYQYADVTFYCYSRDHKLAVTPYSKAYVNMKLVGDSAEDKNGIILEELKDKGVLKTAGFTSSNIDYANLRFLRYMTSSTESKEFIQPYLVQYNESFYDFLARTANRCGEFMYHEGGVLHIGVPAVPTDDPTKLPADSSVIKLDSTQVLAYRYVGYGASPVTTTDVSTDSMDMDAKQKGAGLYASADAPFFHYDELPIDEYLGMFLNKDGFDSFEKEFVKNYWMILIDVLNSILNAPSITQMAAKLVEKYAEAAAFAKFKVDAKNKKGNSKWIDKAIAEQKDTTGKATQVTLFGSLQSNAVKQLNPESSHNLNTKFYRLVNTCSRQVTSQLIEVDADSASPVCALGNIVVFDKKYHVVIEVRETLLDENSEDNADSAGQTIVLAPVCTPTVMMFKETNSKGVDQYTTAKQLSLFCPPEVVPFVRKSAAQRAFVAKNGDPEGYGRVCIRYPWQQAGDSPSPWIRIAVPFAPNDATNDNGGMFFEPSEGDEVLVDYDNGNIEHPIVVGSLFTRRTKAPKDSRAIVSRKGHSITLNDDDSVSDFLAGIYPGLGLTNKYAALGGNSFSFGDNDSFTGGISLNDKWGLYKISASSTDRNITIKCPFGDISVSAFTGITISAPNGDVTIKGKNVSIEAGNELSLISGKFIDEKKKYAEDFLKSLVNSAVSSLLAPLTDLSLVRTIWEALLKPVAGTMTIQSGRYLLLNAGGGKAEIPNKGLNLKGLQKVENDNKEKLMLTETFRVINELSDKWVGEIQTKCETIKTDLEAFNATTFHDKMTKPNPSNVIEEVSKHADTEYKPEDVDFPDTLSDKQLAIDTIQPMLEVIRSDVHAIQTMCKDMKAGMKIGESETTKAFYIKDLKAAIKDIPDTLWPDVVKKVDDKTEKFDTALDKDQACKLMRRVMTEKLIARTCKNKIMAQYPNSKINGGAIVKFSTQADYLDDTKWRDYVRLMDTYRKSLSQTILSSVATKMTENIPGVGWKDERNLWDTCKRGEILMSDKGGKETINIVNGVLTRTPNDDGFMDQVKDTLLSL